MGLKPNPLDLSFFSALTLLVGLFDPLKPVPNMIFNVFGGTLNLTYLHKCYSQCGFQPVECIIFSIV